MKKSIKETVVLGTGRIHLGYIGRCENCNCEFPSSVELYGTNGKPKRLKYLRLQNNP